MRETLTIEKLDGTRKTIEQIKGAVLISINDHGPQSVTEYGQMSGVDGRQDNGTTFDLRTIEATFLFQGIDQWDYSLAMREVWAELFDYEPYYISWSRMPGLRYFVHCKPFQFSKIKPSAGSFTVEFEAFRGFAESLGRTDIDPVDMNSEKYQMIGQGFPVGEDLIYHHTESSFRIFNAGNVQVNPRFNFLLISIKGLGRPRLINLTTGDAFQCYLELGVGDELTIDGVYPRLNGISCGRDTNHGLISLAPGWNDMELYGLTEPESVFGFYFLYK